MNEFHIYDTTLRDGAQQEGMNLSVADKLIIARMLDELGIGYIEGGWPGAIPKDTEFFTRAREELQLKHSVLAAFGATRKAHQNVESDSQVSALLEARTSVVTLVAKTDIRHVKRALRTTGEENHAMIADTVAYLKDQGRRVILDAEHFFDGFRFDPGYTLSCLQTAAEAGAEVIVLCDTNGGMMPSWVSNIVLEVKEKMDAAIGIHAHNDTGCAVANSLAAIEAGARHVQGTINGYGERTGNADLTTIIANLALKYGMEMLPDGQLANLAGIAHSISEITNIAPFARQPYVGVSSFTHKAGLHASAIRVDPDLYQHTDPTLVGNDMRMLVSEMAGRASVELKGKELGFDLTNNPEVLTRVTDRVKELEARGYTFDAADASFELLLRGELNGSREKFFKVESWRTISESGGKQASEETASEATVKLFAGGVRFVATGEGNGPVNALDSALRKALLPVYPELGSIRLVDYKVRILDSASGTDAITRVLIECAAGKERWRTVGVGSNVIEASWEALTDALVFGLVRAGVAVR
ncbi:MAG: citramalate synthase [Propionibacteriaceae bacterium]|jgi:2-isopropylmalate synthase|nr:citramalate synthase [Propionibacteriaceae bacterium]